MGAWFTNDDGSPVALAIADAAIGTTGAVSALPRMLQREE